MALYDEQGFITALDEREIFVFGSNLLGNHAGGAARTAVEKFGAIMGRAFGWQGQSWAIPTLGIDMKKVSKLELATVLEQLFIDCLNNPQYTFYLTPIGQGIAGWGRDEIQEILDEIVTEDMPYPENLIQIGWR